MIYSITGKFLHIFIIFSIPFSIPVVFTAEPLEQFTFQGILKNSDNSLVHDSKNISLRIFNTDSDIVLQNDSACDDSPFCLWHENQTNISVNNGVFFINVGNGSANSSTTRNSGPLGNFLNFTEQYYLQVIIQSDSNGNDEILEPKIPLNAVPFALSAARASADFDLNQKSIINATSLNATAAKITQTGNALALNVTNTGSNDSFRVNDETDDSTPFVIDESGNVGIGTDTPTQSLDVMGNINASGIIYGNGTGLFGITHTSLVSNATAITFLQPTPQTYTGNFTYGSLVGYQAANNICSAEFSETHLCTTDDILSFIANNALSTNYRSQNDAWVAEGAPGFTAPANDCNGFTDDRSTGSKALGAFWNFGATDGGGKGGITTCNVAIQLSCCR